MKNTFLLMAAALLTMPMAAIAGQGAPAAPATTEVIVPEGEKTVITTQPTGQTTVVVDPKEEVKPRGPRDAITGEPVKIDNPKVKEKPQSERDRLRSKMKSGPERK